MNPCNDCSDNCRGDYDEGGHACQHCKDDGGQSPPHPQQLEKQLLELLGISEFKHQFTERELLELLEID